MKILITGANGTIGSDLVNYFSKENKVYGVYRTLNDTIKKIKNNNIIWIKHDIRKKLNLKSKIDILIHCAVVHPFSKKKNYGDYIDTNIIGLKNIIEFSNKKKIKIFLYLSSVKIYGDIKDKVLKDSNTFTNPSILGATKILSEKMLEMQNFNYLSIRLPGVVSYFNTDKRRPWINNVIYKLINNKKIDIYNPNSLFNNVIDTLEIFKFIDFIFKKKIKKDTLNLSATKTIKVKNLIFFFKKKFLSK